MAEQKTKPTTAFAEAFQRAGITSKNFAADKTSTTKVHHNNPIKTSSPSQPHKVFLITTPAKGGCNNVNAHGNKAGQPTKQIKAKKNSKTNLPRKFKYGDRFVGKKKAPTQPSPSASLDDYLQLLHSTYHVTSRRTPAASATNASVIRIADNAAPNPNAFPVEREMARVIPEHDGIRPNLSEDGDEAVEIYIGLDFGTSSTKVILRDSYRQVPYAVPFAHIGSGNPYLFPSRLYLCEGIYTLDQPAENANKSVEILRDLKITLMRRPEQVEYMVHATAYLALIIRHARGWLFSTQSDVYKSSQIEWGLNLGLPAEKSEDPRLNKRFKGMALAAINLAAHPGVITKHIAGKYLVAATRAFAGVDIAELGLSIHPDMVGIFPEIAAQVIGFVESESWDGKSRPYITLIDIGAGTVDVSFFSVEGKSNRKFRFFQNRVEENGVINLHRARIDWLRETLEKRSIIRPTLYAFLDEMYQPTDRLSGIPESVEHYITGLSITGNDHIDDEFKRLRYRKQIFGQVIRPVKEKRVPTGPHWNDLPVFICGGGSRMPLYGNIVDELNNTTGISWFKARRYRLSKPKKLIANGLSEQEYDRLSVAYGLSFPALGEIIKSGEIPNFTRPRHRNGDEGDLWYPLNQD